MSPKVAFFESRLVAIVTQLYKSDQVKIAALAIVITGIIELETVVITVVPVVGWIAGLTTVIAGLTGLENHVKSARRSVGKEILIINNIIGDEKRGIFHCGSDK